MEYLQFSRTVRIISTVVLAFFLWTFGGVFDIAYAVKTGQRLADSAQRVRSQQSTSGAQQPTSQRPEKKLGKDIEELGNVLNDTKTDFDTKKQKVSAKKADIDADDIAIKKQFKETEDKIKDLPDVIKQRHKDFVKKYDDNLATHRTNLDDIDKAKTRTEKDLALKKAKDFLEKVTSPEKHQKFDPNKLPHRTEEPVFKEPRTKPEQFQKESEQRVAGAPHVSFPLVGYPSEERLRTSRSDSSIPTLAKGGEGGFSGPGTNPLLIASNGPLTGLISKKTATAISSDLPMGSYQIALANPPTTADLAETIEVQFTDAIRAKAAELGYKPVQIYNWVRNSIEYVPIYGSIQGADMCLQTKLCNDMDTASLLIALLRASGIHARYVYGTIEVPIEKVKNWVGGFTDSTAALNLMATGGIPVGGITEGGKIVTVRKEHMWVEAWIDMIPSQGAVHRVGDTWIPLDASFKQNDFRQGIDFSAAVPFDSTALTSSLVNSATINQAEGWITGIDGSLATTAVADYRGRIEAYMTQSVQNASVENVVGSTRIIKQEFAMLMGTLPYKTVAKGTSYSAIPDSLRHKLGFMIENSDTYSDVGSLYVTYSLSQIAGKKITVSYAPATAADEAVINSYLPIPHSDGTPIQIGELPSSLPAYLINLKPELKIDGQVVATGDSVTMGSVGNLNMTFINPARRSDIVINTIVAGEYWGIAVGVSRISGEVMKVAQDRMLRTKTKLASNDFSGLTSDDILGEMLYYTAMLYEARMDGHDTVLARSLGVKAVRLPSEAVFKSTLQVDDIWGIPISARAGGLMMDVGRQLSLVNAYDGDNGKKLEFMRYSGINSSVFEHRVPEQLFAADFAEGISAVKALQIANDSRMPIYTITRDNINVILPQLQLDTAVIDDIRNAVNSGKEVVVSRTNISFRGWTGCGYVITDPITGNGAFMISGEQRGAYILITTIGIATANPVVITAGLRLLSGDIIVSLTADFVKFVGIGATEPVDWCGSKGSEWVPDYPFGIDATEACKTHDNCYNAAPTPFDKVACDDLLGIDLLCDCIYQNRNPYLCGIVAEIYTFGVLLWGWSAWGDAL